MFILHVIWIAGTSLTELSDEMNSDWFDMEAPDSGWANNYDLFFMFYKEFKAHLHIRGMVDYL